MAFRLGGLLFQFSSAGPSVVLRLPGIYSPFTANSFEPGPGASYQILEPSSDMLLSPEPPGLLWQARNWRMGRTESGRIGIDLHDLRRDRWIPVANFEPDFSSGEIRPVGFRDEPAPYSLNYPYDQAVLLHRLLHFRAGVVHACGLSIEGRGLIFCGRSGAGKTTIARLWKAEGATLLNDDRVILRAAADGPRLESSPWHGEDPEVNNLSVPLRAIVHLNQASENRLSRLRGAGPLAALLATSVAPFYSAPAMEMLLEPWSRMVEGVPSYRLDFTPDRRAVEVCRKELSLD